MEFDFLKFVLAAGPVIALLVPIVIALGTAIGKLGADGKLQFGLTAGCGLVLGLLGMIAQLGVPTNFAYWFGDIVVGLMTGLSAVGVYEAAIHASFKGSEESADKTAKER